MCRDPERRHSRKSCDQVVSAAGRPDKVGCACSVVEIDYTRPLESPAAITQMVRTNYSLSVGNAPRPRDGAAPHGVTCQQVCEELKAPSCQGERCDRLVLPWERFCPKCGDTRLGDSPLGDAVVADDVIVTSRRGQHYVIYPDSGRIRRVAVPTSARRPNVAGPFVVWERNQGFNTPLSIDLLDVRSLKVTTVIDPRGRARGTCQYYWTGSRLAQICRTEEQFRIWPLMEGRKTIHSPVMNEGRALPSSWDGKTLAVRARAGMTLVWSVGDRDWKQQEPAVEMETLRPSWSTGVILRKLHETAPDTPGFVDAVY